MSVWGMGEVNEIWCKISPFGRDVLPESKYCLRGISIRQKEPQLIII